MHGVTPCDTNILVSDENDRDETPKKNAGPASPGAPAEKKERVLHTRVPAVLEEELKRLATALRMPVSNLVRAVLEDAVDAVEVVGERAEGELKGIVSKIHERRETLRGAVQTSAREQSAKATAKAEAEAAPTTEPVCPETSSDLDGIVGVQRLTLIADSKCTVCGRALPRGSEACRGVRDEPGPKLLLGPRCGLVPDGA